MIDLRCYVGRVPDPREVVALLHAAGGAGKAQLLDGDLVAGHDHLVAALHAARRALADGTAAAKDPGLEVLRRASGERQIGKALAKMGLREGGERLVAAVALDEAGATALDEVARALAWRRDDVLLEAERREGGVDALLERWGVGANERGVTAREKWKDLVLERVALTDAWK